MNTFETSFATLALANRNGKNVLSKIFFKPKWHVQCVFPEMATVMKIPTYKSSGCSIVKNMPVKSNIAHVQCNGFFASRIFP